MEEMKRLGVDSDVRGADHRGLAQSSSLKGKLKP